MTTNEEVASFLAFKNITFNIEGGHKTKRKDWDCYGWNAEFRRAQHVLNSAYFTGLGHSTAPLRSAQSRPIVPTAADVLHALLLDGDAIDCSFHSWCFEFDRNNDSIEDMKTYLLCCELGSNLRKFFSAEERTKLAELLEDF